MPVRATLALFVLNGCVTGPPSSADDCASGQIGIDSICRTLCGSNRDCDLDTVCSDGACVPGQRQLVISSVDGDGDRDGDQHLVHAGLVVTGEQLTAATAELVSSDGSTVTGLVVRAGATSTRLKVELPVDLVSGDYVLRVVSQFGEIEEVTLTLMQGDQGDIGPIGSCGPAACVSLALPGIGAVSTVVASANNGGATPGSISVNGVPIPVVLSGNSIWLSVFDRTTHILSTDPTHERAYSVDPGSELDALVGTLAALGSSDLAIMITEGDVAAAMNSPAAASTLGAELVQLGASQVVFHLTGNEALVIIGYPGIGEGNADLVLSSTGLASATTVVADEHLLGARTSALDGLGRVIDTTEIADGTIQAEDLAPGEITGAYITNGSVGGADIGDGQITSTKIADGSITGANISVPVSIGSLNIAANGNIGVGVASPTQNLHVAGNLGFGGVGLGGAPSASLIHVPNFNGTCAVGGPAIREWSARSCNGAGACTTPSCTTGSGWSPSAPSCSYESDTGSGCEFQTCTANSWSQVICIGD